MFTSSILVMSVSVSSSLRSLHDTCSLRKVPIDTGTKTVAFSGNLSGNDGSVSSSKAANSFFRSRTRYDGIVLRQCLYFTHVQSSLIGFPN
jgi:hypothetical protein